MTMTKSLLLIITCAVLAAVFYIFHQLLMPTAWLSLGLVIGVAWYILDPQVLFPRYQKLADLTFPLSHSFWMLLIFWPLALFIMTSTGSWLAQGIMLALGLGLGIDLVTKFSQPELIKTVFHFPAESKWNATELQVVSAGWGVGLLVLILLFVI